MNYSPEKESVWKFFYYSKNERAALIAFIGLGVLFSIAHPFIEPFLKKRELTTSQQLNADSILNQWLLDTKAFQDSIALAKANRKWTYTSKYKKNSAQRNKKKFPSNGFKEKPSYQITIDLSIPLPKRGTIDPNLAEPDQLLRLGIPERVVKTWSRFKSKGGTFISKNDISKIYGLEDSTFKRILPYFKEDIVDDSKEHRPEAAESEPLPSSNLEVEINAATREELTQIRGIGNYSADQIVKYRNKLGGFRSFDQFSEISGLREPTLTVLLENTVLDTAAIVLVKINRDNLKQLSAHPYISYKKAKTIIAYRKNHGPFTSIKDVEEMVVLNPVLEKLGPYLSFD